MTPVRYAERYLKLEVPFDDGPTTVQIVKYHIGAPDAEQGRLWQALTQYFHDNQKKEPGWRLRLKVDGQAVEFSSAHEMLHRAVNPFWGKGSPEDCQIVLQLAVLLGRVPHKAALQAYCDDHLGLDCNGFAGNYIFRVFKGGGWRSDGTLGPSSQITDIMAHSGAVVHTADDILPTRMYVLAEVNAQNNIIPGGPSSSPGHIVITEPGRFINSFMSMDLTLGESGVLGHPAFWGVESTGGIGLVQSWYVITQLTEQGKPVDGVFRVLRGSKRQFLNFRMRALS